MLIRSAEAHEAELLTGLALRSKAYWGYDDAFVAACREELAVRPDEVAERRMIVAEHDGVVVGFASLDGEPPKGAVGMMFVDPEFIGRGVGRLLLERILATARQAGFPRLTIDADPNAEAFYLAMGAVRVGTAPSGSIPGRVLPLLELAVDEPAAT
ncbi:N-acetylglutamate synthase, GNAT family [Streptomyces sp. WMMB 714]|uniref:GNAT family N-acetyltransferase n=1 Tax=Streptomyces sp. WMMB 714 TaxID=1286822 RepID=UPI0005F7CF8F|nr:GNAT family N-acetyltransferase [Streptomyces sp. WMMB 714]SCK36825.1 N-acetylglutamate synthase, GNAT family [Streptomyces sp. WMMB 714]